MRPPRGRRLFAWIVLAAGCADLEDGLDAAPIVWAGDHLAFGVGEGAREYCGGAPPYLDGFAAALLPMLKSRAIDLPIHYSLVRPDDLPDASGTSTAAGVFTEFPIVEHELVHAVNRRRDKGLSHPLLEEGFAEYFGGDGFPEFRDDSEIDIAQALRTVDRDLDIPADLYPGAGRFVAFLVSEYGLDTALDLHARTPRSASSSAFKKVLEERLGEHFDQTATRFGAYPTCLQKEYRDASPTCAVFPVTSACGGAGGAWAEVELDCGLDALGVRDGEIWVYRTLEFPGEGRYGLTLEASTLPGGKVELRQCSGGCGTWALSWTVPTSATPIQVFEVPDAGHYLARFSAPPGDTRTIRLSLTALDDQCPAQ